MALGFLVAVGCVLLDLLRRFHVAGSIRMMERTAKIILAVLRILLGFAHMCVPDPVDRRRGLLEVFRHAGHLVPLEEQLVSGDMFIDFFARQRRAVEKQVIG